MSEKLHVLIVDDDRRMTKTLTDILTVKGFDTEAAHSGPEALDKVKRIPFDCVITDIKMPEMDGVELYRAIKKVKSEIPVVLMTAYSTDKLVKEGLEEGVIATLSKPLDINLLLGFFSALKRERSIVIIDDDLKFCKTLGDILQERGFSVTEVTDPDSFMEKLKSDSQVVLLDMKLNGISGLDVLKEIREQYPELPVILVTGYRKEMTKSIENGLNISAFTCLYKPFQIDELLEVLNKVKKNELATVLGRPVRK